MEIKKKEELKIKMTIDEAIKIRADFGKLSGMTDDMTIVEFMERLDMVL